MSPSDPEATPAAAELDPEIRRFVLEMGAGWARHPELARATPAEARRIAEAVRAPWTRGGPSMAAIDEHALPGTRGPVRVRRYVPTAAAGLPALVYLHGGGWTLFSLDTHDRLMRELAARAGVVVLGVDYALSPEAKYPAALDQVCEVVRHVASHGAELGVDPSRLAVGGDSAGANLAIATSLWLRDEGSADLVRALLLAYGVFDRESSAEARRRLGGPGNMLTSEEMEAFWGNYLRDERDAASPFVSPLRADLHGLPPTFLVVPACDLLAEQSLQMATRLRAADVAVEAAVYAGASHSFLEAVSIAPLADRALTESAAWLRGILR